MYARFAINILSYTVTYRLGYSLTLFAIT